MGVRAIKPVRVFESATVTLQAHTVEELIARAVKWQYTNATRMPINVCYIESDGYHSVSIEHIQPYDEETIA